MAAQCTRPGSCPVRPAAVPAAEAERLVLCVIRFVKAAYDTGDVACSEAGHARAEAARGVLEGALLVARITAVVRLLRTARPGFAILPPCSRWLSADEEALMRALRDARLEVALGLVGPDCATPFAAAAEGLLPTPETLASAA